MDSIAGAGAAAGIAAGIAVIVAESLQRLEHRAKTEHEWANIVLTALALLTFVSVCGATLAIIFFSHVHVVEMCATREILGAIIGVSIVVIIRSR
jgi:hypothetical protein